MPTYYAAGVNIRLSTTSAAASLSPTTAKKVSGDETRRVESAIAAADILSEWLIDLNLDCSSDVGDPLHFLGSERTVPFYCVGVKNPHTCLNKTKPNHEAKPSSANAMEIDSYQTPISNGSNGISTRRSSHQHGIDTSNSSLSSLGSTPLCSPSQSVSMDLLSEVSQKQNRSASNGSKLSLQFRRVAPLDPRLTQATAPLPLSLVVNHDRLLSYSRKCSTSQKPQDIKIDVFFNGHSTHSSYFCERHRNEINATTSYYSGMRVDRLVEAAWLVFPSTDQTTHVSEKKSTCTVDSLAKQRWERIAEAVGAEANSLGLDEKLSRSPLGDYLYGLSKLPMPPAILDLTNASGKSYGVIDVIITLGRGKKFSAAHGSLRQPEKLKDPRYTMDNSVLEPDSKVSEQDGKGKIEISKPKLKLYTLAATRSKRLSTPSRLSSGQAAEPLASGSDSQLQASARSTSALLNDSQELQPIPTSIANVLDLPSTKRRKLNGKSKLASGASSYSPIQRLARRPAKETKGAVLGPPRIFFPDRDPSYFRGETQSRQNKRITIKIGKTSKPKGGKKSRIVTFRGPSLAYITPRCTKPEDETLDELAMDHQALNTNSTASKQVLPVHVSGNATSTLQDLSKSNNGMNHVVGKQNVRSLASALDGPHWSLPDISTILDTPLPPDSAISIPTDTTATSIAALANLKSNKPAVVKNSVVTPAIPRGRPSLSNPDSSTNVRLSTNNISDSYRVPPFPIPDLSHNCVLSYLPPSEVATLDKKKSAQAASETGALRQRRAERTGLFYEDEVLLGCRYIVGG